VGKIEMRKVFMNGKGIPLKFTSKGMVHEKKLVYFIQLAEVRREVKAML